MLGLNLKYIESIVLIERPETFRAYSVVANLKLNEEDPRSN